MDIKDLLAKELELRSDLLTALVAWRKALTQLKEDNHNNPEIAQTCELKRQNVMKCVNAIKGFNSEIIQFSAELKGKCPGKLC